MRDRAQINGYIWKSEMRAAQESNRLAAVAVERLLDEPGLSRLALVHIGKVAAQLNRNIQAINRLDEIAKTENGNGRSNGSE